MTIFGTFVVTMEVGFLVIVQYLTILLSLGFRSKSLDVGPKSGFDVQGHGLTGWLGARGLTYNGPRLVHSTAHSSPALPLQSRRTRPPTQPLTPGSMCANHTSSLSLTSLPIHVTANPCESNARRSSLSQAYLGCVAVGSPRRLLHPQAHRGDRPLRDLDGVDHLLRRLVHHVEAAHGAGAKTPRRFTESIEPFPRLSCFQTCKKNSVSFAVLLGIRELSIGECGASLADVTGLTRDVCHTPLTPWAS